MVTLEEIRKKRKIKMLFKGGFGSGKTFTCMKIVNVALKAEKKVLFLDHERGAIEEIEKYFVDNNITDLSNFEHEDFRGYSDLDELIKKYTTENEKKVDLIVIDPLPLVQLCRLSAIEDIKSQGYYYEGTKVVMLEDDVTSESFRNKLKRGEVDSRKTHELQGWHYSLPNTWEMNFQDKIVSVPADIIATLLLPDEKNSLEPQFDYVMELLESRKIESTQKVVSGKLVTESVTTKVYKGIPQKIRGQSTQVVEEIEDPWKAVIKPFCKKYLNRKCDDENPP